MMGALRDWILSILAAAFFLALLQAAMPKGAVRQVGSLAAGLVLFLVILRPVISLTPEWLTGFMEREYQAASAYPQDLEEVNETYLETIMSQRCEEYIISQAAEMGCTVEAQVDCVWSDGWPVPDSATVYGTAGPQTQELLSAYMQSELGIPEERIRYEEAMP